MIWLDSYKHDTFRATMRELLRYAEKAIEQARTKLDADLAGALEWGHGDALLRATFLQRVASQVLASKEEIEDEKLRMWVAQSCFQALLNLTPSSSPASNNLKFQEANAAAELLQSLFGHSAYQLATHVVLGQDVADERAKAERAETPWKRRVEYKGWRDWRVVEYNADMVPLKVYDGFPRGDLALKRAQSLPHVPGGIDKEVRPSGEFRRV